MIILLDTSIFIAANQPAHIHHTAVRQWRTEAVAQGATFIGASHALAEFFRVLTSPVFKISPRDVAQMVEALERAMPFFSLTPEEYVEAVQLTEVQGLSSGAVYDALHVRAAGKGGATHVASLDKRSFPHLLPPKHLITVLS